MADKETKYSALGVLRTAWAYLLFGVYLLWAFPVAVYSNIFRNPYNSRFFVRITQKYVKFMLWACGVSVVKIQVENLEKAGHCVMVSNHTSLLDIFTASQAVRPNMKGLAKKEIKHIPWVGLFFSVVSVFVDRKDPDSRQKSLELCANEIQAGHSFLIFPEGTRNRTSDILQPFRDGAFKLAIQAQCPILPFITPDNRFLMPMRDKILRSGIARIIYLEPISTQNLCMEDLPDLKQKVFDLMLKALQEYTH